MTKILVTGATGFIGSRIVHQLLTLGHKVRILRRRSSRLDLLGEAASQVEHLIGDVTNAESVVAAVSGMEVVFHAAAIVNLGAPRVRHTNVEGTANVVNAALREGIQRLIHTSRSRVYIALRFCRSARPGYVQLLHLRRQPR